MKFNLDDEKEVCHWIGTIKTTKGRELANLLGIGGAGAVSRANNLSLYAWNKWAAICFRLEGNVFLAQKHESICDRIFTRMDKRDRW